jgi:hypothetical protein
LNDNELAIWKCLYQCYIPADQLISLMQEYAKEKYKRGATLKGVVNLTKGPAGMSLFPYHTTVINAEEILGYR